MKNYDLKTIGIDHIQSKTKNKNSKGLNNVHLKSNSQKKLLSHDKIHAKNGLSNENKKSIFSQLGNNIVYNYETCAFDMIKENTNKENDLEPKKNALNYSADKNEYSTPYNHLNKLSNSNNNTNVQLYNYSNKNSNSTDALLNTNNNRQNNNQNPFDSSTEAITYIIEDNQLNKYINICEIWLDLHNSIDSKQGMINLSKKYLSVLRDESQDITFNFEIFNNINLNKAFSKSCKISLIVIIFIKFILTDFQYDNNLKTSLKKLFSYISETFITIADIFIITPLLTNKKEVKSDFHEKLVKFTKSNKINKKLYPNEMSNLFVKMTEGCLNSIKLFSKYNDYLKSSTYFKTGFFKPIHNIVYDLTRNFDKLSINKLIILLVDNILFGYLIQNLQPTVLTNKQLLFSPSSFNFLFQSPSPPFLSPLQEGTYTLVLDLDETLVHFFYTPSGGSFLIRPKAFEFLKTLSSLYEICIFTAAMKDYADSILDIIDKEYKLIKHRLYRNHTSIVGNGFIKVISLLNRDISKLGRDLSKVIIIDNLPENFRLQINNGLGIRTWNEDMKDTQLVDLLKILQDIITYKVTDVRMIIKKIREEITKSKNTLNPYSSIDISKYI